MGAVDIEPKQKKGSGLRRQKRRVAIRIDMTPMVDVAFLLLIFFMVTTVFRQPQAMEMNLPPADAVVEVPESNVMTIYVNQEQRMSYKMGKGDLVSTGMNELKDLFIENTKLNPELIILVKIHRGAPYETMVDIMDELEIAGMTRFSLVAMTEEEQNTIGTQI